MADRGWLSLTYRPGRLVTMNEQLTQDFSIEMLADRTMQMLDVRPGQVIWIWASTHSLDLIEALALRTRQRGAFWMLRLIIESLLQKIGQGVPDEYLGLIPEHELRLLSDVSAIIEVHDHGGHIPDVPLKRRRTMGSEWIALHDESARQKVRHVIITNPTPALASAYRLPFESLHQAYAGAYSVDYEEVDRLQARLAERLQGVDNVHILSSSGTDLSLRIQGRPILQDTDSLPFGEVYIAPIEDSAKGQAVIDLTFVQGKPVKNLRLRFSDGRIVDFDSPDPDGWKAFRELLDASSGDKDRIAEFAIGLNPGVAVPIGDIAIDEKIGGSVHIAVGMNDHFGGLNHSNLHKDLVILKPTVFIDGQVIVDRGKLRI